MGQATLFGTVIALRQVTRSSWGSVLNDGGVSAMLARHAMGRFVMIAACGTFFDPGFSCGAETGHTLAAELV